jgi:hypothetical protein
MELDEAKAVVVIARHKEERSSEDGGGSELGPAVQGERALGTHVRCRGRGRRVG